MFNKNKLIYFLLASTLVIGACSDRDKDKTNSTPTDESTDGSTSATSIGVTSMVFSKTNVTQNISMKMQELLGLEEGDSRDLMVKIWYPAESNPDENSRRHYGYHTKQNDYPVAPDDIDTLEILRANQQQSQSYQNAAPINTQSFPTIFYSHGYDGVIEENEPYYEALVEKGFVVVSIGHTHEASFVTLKNNETVSFNEDLEEDIEEREIPIVERDPNLEFTADDSAALSTIPLGELPLKDLLKKYHYTTANIGTGNQEHLNLWVLDTHFVLSQLEKINSGEIDSTLKGIFDLTRIGATGHSYGGATGRRFCNQIPNCLASINMDGSSFTYFDEKILVPHLEYSSDNNANIEEAIRDEELDDENLEDIRQILFMDSQNNRHANIYAASDDLYLITLESIAHSDYSEGWIDFHDYGLGKEILHPLLESTSVDFFEMNLKAGLPKSEFCRSLENNERIILDFTNACGGVQ